jgi:hypothetical protein
MAATWGIKTLLVDADDYISDVVWYVTDAAGNYVGVSSGVFKPEDGHPLRTNTYDQYNENQIIAQVKASLGGQEVAKAERDAAQSRAKQRKPIENYKVNKRRAVV